MSLTHDAHHLQFKDYKFPLEDRAFLDKVAFIHYDGAAKSKRVSDAIRETLRILTAYNGFQAHYSVSSTVKIGTKPLDNGNLGLIEQHQVSERVDLVGQDKKGFGQLNLINGALLLPTYLQAKKAGDEKEGDPKHEFISSPVQLIAELEKAFEAERSAEWWLKDGNKFQVATFLYEWRRIVLDLPFGFHGHVWKDNHGVVHFYATQADELEFADERLNLYLSITLPSVFNGKVIELEKAEQVA
jgi:hypothetical protein